MSPQEIAKCYLQALEEASTTKVLALFTESGCVNSPLYGEKSAAEFYPELFKDTSTSKLTLKGVMEGSSVSAETKLISIWFHFDWVLADGEPAPFDVVDVLEICSSTGLISKLHIVYDTYPIRGAFMASKEQFAS